MLYHDAKKWQAYPLTARWTQNGVIRKRYTHDPEACRARAANSGRGSDLRFSPVTLTAEQHARLDEINELGIPAGQIAAAVQYVADGIITNAGLFRGIERLPRQIRSTLEALGRVTAQDKIAADGLSEKEIAAIADLFSRWADDPAGTWYELQTLRYHDGELYECIQAHGKQADRAPGAAASLWTIRSAPGVIAEWVQPAGSHDAYNTGDRVTHNGKTWESTIDANTTEPGTLLEHGYWIEV